jgi:pimeloyl-ACP methyl ester carboxylesterase
MVEPRIIRVAIDDDVELVADVYEAAEPHGAVIACHGFGSERRGGKVEALGTVLPDHGWTVIAPDLQGHGDSGGPFDLTTVERSVGDLKRIAELPEFTGAPRRAFVGSSFGGLVAGWAVADDPTLAERLILVAPAFGFLDRYLLTLPDDEREAWIGGEVHALRVPHLAGETLLPEVLLQRSERSWQKLAAALETPTLIVHGRKDETVPWQASVDFAELCPRDDLDLILIGDGDHGLADRLDDLVHHTLRFLGTAPT